MALVLEIGCTTHQRVIHNTIVAILRRYGVEGEVRQSGGKIVCRMKQEHPALEEALVRMEELLPASVFMRGSSHYIDETEVSGLPSYFDSLPLSLGICPQCQKEMFDPASRRYYYPFTSCKNCGGQYGLFERYPYTRENTKLRIFRPCGECEAEMASNPFRLDYPQIGCHSCGVPVKFVIGENVRYANDPSSYKTVFEVAAKAIAEGKKIGIKTLMGHRTFYPVSMFNPSSVLMVIDASKIMQMLSLIDEEFHALLSIERPILHLAVADESLKSQVGNTADVHYPDDGFTVLLCRELLNLGIGAVAYDEQSSADAQIDFDLEVNTQSPMRLFLNKDVRFVAQGERASFPAYTALAKEVVSVAHGLAAIPQQDRMLIDCMERFESVATTKVNALSGEELPFSHGNLHRFEQDSASFMAVLAGNDALAASAVGAYFDETITFLYAKRGHVTRVVPSEAFEPSGLIERIGSLREGSDRLIANLQNRHTALYDTLVLIETSGCDLFEAAARIAGLSEPGMDALMREALNFVGKGGLQIDTKLKDNRFDSVAFLASIISYRVADVPSGLLCYSIFESLGDYFSDILTELKNRSKADHVVICGSGFANQSLYSRVARNLKNTPPLLARSFPIGRENGVIGGIYL